MTIKIATSFLGYRENDTLETLSFKQQAINLCILSFLILTSFMWGKQSTYLGSKWIAQGCITSFWSSLGQNSGLPSPRALPNTGQTWNEAVGSQGAGDAGNLIHYLHYPGTFILAGELRECHSSLNSRTDTFSATLESENCLWLWHFLNAWPWGHRYRVRLQLSKSSGLMVTIVQRMGRAHVIDPSTVRWLGENLTGLNEYDATLTESIGWKNELSISPQTVRGGAESTLRGHQSLLGPPSLSCSAQSQVESKYPPQSYQLVGSEVMRMH